MKFQDDISNMNTYTHTHTHIGTSRNQYVPHFFKFGGIKITFVSFNFFFFLNYGDPSCNLHTKRERTLLAIYLKEKLFANSFPFNLVIYSPQVP